MARYLTQDTERETFVFQMKIPLAARSHFENKMTIRIRLGNLDQAAASVRAAQLATDYQLLFAQNKTEAKPNSAPARHICATTHWVMDAQLAERFAATWQTRAAADFKARLTAKPMGIGPNGVAARRLAHTSERDQGSRI